MASDNLHDADILRGDEDADGEGEGLDDLRPPHVVQDEETVRQVAGQEQPSHSGNNGPSIVTVQWQVTSFQMTKPTFSALPEPPRWRSAARERPAWCIKPSVC